MKTATITETKNGLSALLDLVRRGESILITDRRRPVARIEPVGTIAEDSSGRIARLERAGVVRRPKSIAGADPLAEPPPRARGKADILDALLDERRDSR